MSLHPQSGWPRDAPRRVQESSSGQAQPEFNGCVRKSADSGFSANFPRRCQHFIRPGAHAEVFREVCPADGARGVDQEFRRAGNIAVLGPAARVQKVISTDGFRFWVRQDWESVSTSLDQIGGLLQRVCADSHRTNTGPAEFIKVLFNASQLEVAERSPVSAVEDQQHGLGFAIWPRRIGQGRIQQA